MKAGGPSSFVLRPKAAYRALVRRHGGLDGSIRITFAARGHGKLRDELPVRFRRAERGQR